MSLVLIVDDDTWNAALVARILQEMGLRSIHAADPRFALPMLRHEKPSLVLLDYQMPGMDGLELLTAIRKESAVPVVMLTSADRADLAVRAIRLGAHDYLTKPVDEARLREIADAAIRASAAPDANRIGPYEIREELGRGGMGVVYAAHDPRLERAVALKVLLPELAANPEYEAYFLREARGAAKVAHPNIVTVYDAGRDRGRLYLVMERVQGRTLQARVQSGPAPTPRETFRIGLQAADALEAVHAAGLVHRDLKPGNLMLGTDGTLKVLDFGLARPAPTAPPPGSAVAISVSGTLAYAPPELLRGGEVGVRGDIYALGVVLYELLAGVQAFQAKSDAVLMLNVVEGKLAKPWSELGAVPPAALDLLRRMMALDPLGRPASMREVADALRSLPA